MKQFILQNNKLFLVWRMKVVIGKGEDFVKIKKLSKFVLLTKIFLL